MRKAFIQRSENIYNFLLNFYPRSYRQEFGEEMKYVFSQSLNDAYTEQGDFGIISMWKNTIIDASKSLVKEHIENEKGGVIKLIKKNKDIVSVIALTIIILALPLIGMQFSEGVDWSLFDFILMGSLISGTGLLAVFVKRKVKNPTHRLAIIIALIAALLVVWVHLAVGIVDTWPLAGS